MMISKSVLIIRFGLAKAKSRQAESVTLSPYDEDLDLTTPHCRQYARNDRDFDHIAGNVHE